MIPTSKCGWGPERLEDASKEQLIRVVEALSKERVAAVQAIRVLKEFIGWTRHLHTCPDCTPIQTGHQLWEHEPECGVAETIAEARKCLAVLGNGGPR